MIKKNGILLLIVIIISLLVPAVVRHDMESNHKVIQEEQIMITNNPDIQYNIDEVNGNQYIEIRGWAVELNEPILVFDTQVGLWDEESGQVIILPAVLEAREDINKQYKNKGYDYTNSGFYTKVNSNVLENDVTYKILIFLQKNEMECIDTGRTLKKGEV